MKIGIFFEPDKYINNYIIKKKLYLSKLFKNHYKIYTNESPHITLFTCNIILNDFDNLLKRLEKNKKKLHHKFKIDGYKIFYNDPSLDKLNTLHIPIKKNDEIVKLQLFYLNLLNDFIIEQNLDNYPKLYSNNINKYKYPFVGIHWKPHLTISAFNNYDIKIVRELLNIKINKTLKLNRLSLHKIVNKKSYKVMNI
tara:strand:+ start:277 stop:864 length:588 start_codon:yes stop_codon:yes gene_type:complete